MPRRRSLVLALLGASLALNLALGALLIWPPPPPRSFEAVMARLAATLPAADRPVFEAVLEAERVRYGAALAALRRTSAAVDRAIRQDPFDPAALSAAVADWSMAWAGFNHAFGETMLRALSEISPAGRLAIADSRRRGP